ncbi:MAG: hypothetical protein HFACDABA_00003 [Anaerolineales bacterium]|nr:hypothetical protein [Anaerolineales bacterium]
MDLLEARSLKKADIPLAKRLLWMLVVVAIQSVYLPTSLATSGGIAPRLPIDVIPVYPVWVVPYYFTYALWLFALFWALFKSDARQFRAVISGALLTVTVGALTFIFFPTYIELPVIRGGDIFSVMLRAVQAAGGTHAALPSAHNYGTMLVCAFAVHFDPRRRWLWGVTVAVIALSTLFTGQHYLLDVVTGLALGWIGFKFGIWQANRNAQ